MQLRETPALGGTIMRLPEFTYFSPTTVSEACALLREHEGHVRLMAGGTDLLVSMKQQITTPEHVVGLKGIPDLRYIRQDADGTRIGALTPISTLERSPVVSSRFPILAEAAGAIAAPNLRNMGTIGGNICLDTRCCYYNKSRDFRDSIGSCLKLGGDVCHITGRKGRCLAVSQGDTAPALIALGAKVTLQSDGGSKTIPIEDLFRSDGKDYLALVPGEIVTEIIVPDPRPNTCGSFRKARTRKAIDFATASAAISLTLTDGICEDIRIVLGSVGTHPVRVVKAEEALRGKRLTADLIEEAASCASAAASPAANILDAPPSYRRELAGALVAEAVQEAVSRAL